MSLPPAGISLKRGLTVNFNNITNGIIHIMLSLYNGFKESPPNLFKRHCYNKLQHGTLYTHNIQCLR